MDLSEKRNRSDGSTALDTVTAAPTETTPTMNLSEQQRSEAKALCKQRAEIQQDICRIFSRVEDRKRMRKEGILTVKPTAGGLCLCLRVGFFRLTWQCFCCPDEWERALKAAQSLLDTVPAWPKWMPESVRKAAAQRELLDFSPGCHSQKGGRCKRTLAS